MPRLVQYVPISSIVMDRTIPLRPKTLQIVEAINNGADLPPVKLQSIGAGKLRLRDGRHRFTAYKLLGYKFIKAKFSTKISRKVN